MKDTRATEIKEKGGRNLKKDFSVKNISREYGISVIDDSSCIISL